eukprot:TRINITY_DN4005_c0_g1_i2.p1 TRINITY_DN4005_c0_g1~~TRINITY_DN4005_c0_g1_i2.p1  ORF type:complete len:418 (-),score=130.82 TRINITY_DN4005_c0_g1_i2:103-1356(-)
MMITPRRYQGKIRHSIRSKRRSCTDRSSSPDITQNGYPKFDKIIMKPPHEMTRKEKKKLAFSFLPELTPRYKCLRVLGSGSYGKVFECWDRRRSIRVAIKCQSGYIADTIKREISVMQKIQSSQSQRKNSQSFCIQLLDWFEMEDYNCICMVLEKCPQNLDELIQKTSSKAPHGVSMSLVKKWTTQILIALKSLHDLEMVHSDLKPENIMLAPSDLFKLDHRKDDQTFSKHDLDVRLIDFGLSMHLDDIKTRVIGTRQFSGPEISLKIGWGKPLDIWALGCLVCELVTGRTLFDTHENLEHMAIMEAILGPFPADLVQRCIRINDQYDRERAADSDEDSGSPKKYFDSSSRLRWPEYAPSNSSINFVSRRKPLYELLRGDEYSELYDFVSKLLKYRPEERMTAAEALKHPFLATSRK